MKFENGVKVKIEKGVPLPGSAYKCIQSWAVLDQLEVGESFTVPLAMSQLVRMSISQRHRRRGGARFVTRTISQTDLRVWREK